MEELDDEINFNFEEFFEEDNMMDLSPFDDDEID